MKFPLLRKAILKITQCSVLILIVSPACDDGKLNYSSSSLIINVAISSVSPNRLITVGGTLLTLTGSGLNAVQELRIGETSCTDLSIIDDSTLTCASPVNSTGTYAITISDSLNKSKTLQQEVTYSVDAFTQYSHVAGLTRAGLTVNGIGPAVGVGLIVDMTKLNNIIYLADSWGIIRSLDTSTGQVETIAGSPLFGYSDGASDVALFDSPSGITNDGTFLYVSDNGNHVIRQIDPLTGTVSTFAGLAGQAGDVDAIGSAARFNLTRDLECDGTYIYVADYNNYKIRKVQISNAEVTTLSGLGTNGDTDGSSSVATLRNPRAITLNGGILYVAQNGNGRIRAIDTSDGSVTTLAGSTKGYSDGTGASAKFYWPNGLTSDATNLYVADTGYSGFLPYSVIRKIVIATGVTTTIAGSYGVTGGANGIGSAASFTWTYGVFVDANTLYIGDNSQSLRQMDLTTFEVSQVTGTDGANSHKDGSSTEARFKNEWGDITSDGVHLYVGEAYNNTLRKINIATGTTTTLSGSPGNVGSNDGLGASATWNYPLGVAVNGDYVYATDYNKSTLRKVHKETGATTTVAGLAGVTGDTDGLGGISRFKWPSSITVEGGSVFIADYGNSIVRRYDPLTDEVSTIAGQSGVRTSSDGNGTSATFSSPWSITSCNNALYIYEYSNTIRKIDLLTMDVTTIAGLVNEKSMDTGVGVAINWGTGLACDGENLYHAEGPFIRKIRLSDGAVSFLGGVSDSQNYQISNSNYYDLSVSVFYDTAFGLFSFNQLRIRRIH